MASKWRSYKNLLKSKYFYRNKSVEFNLKKHPADVQADQWQYLVSYWMSDKGKRIEEATKRSRAYQKITHTSGSKSFVRVEDELNEAAGSNVGRIKVYEVTHTRKNGSYLDPEIPVLLEKARAKKAERSGTQSTDSYQEDLEIMSEVLGNERPGRVRGLGLGPTPTRVFSPRVSTIHTDEEFEKLQREVVEQRGMIQSLHEKLDFLMQHMAMPQDVATNSTPGHRRVPSSHSRHGGLVLD
ncbi:hypothetical protein SLA2020_191370 [Shorea laevis]